MDSIPSRDPANDDSLTGLFRTILRKDRQQFDGMLPAIVEAHDRDKNRVKVRPLIPMVTTGKAIIQRASIPSVPVLRLGGGGFFISFPLQVGDLGWVKANDRDISLFLQSLKEAKPNTKRMHSFSDAVFIPDVIKAYTISEDDSAALVIQSTDGATKISVKEGVVTIKAGAIVNEGDLTVIGNIITSGDVTADGTVTGKTEVVARETPFSVGVSTHTHTSNGPGAITSPPTAGS